MTLFRQLFTSIFAILVLLFVVVTTIELNSIRHFLTQQQRTNLNYNLNTMQLLLTPNIEGQDPALITTAIDTLFNDGLYQGVQASFPDPSRNILRSYSGTENTSPSWFQLLPLFSEQIENDSFQNQQGETITITVITDPSFVYNKMWQSTWQLSAGFLALFGLMMVVISMILKRVLAPLEIIKMRALEISQQQFGDPLPLPETAEFKAVVNAFNKMSEKIETNFHQQASEANRLRNAAYVDSVSHLYNRTFFTAQLTSWITETGLGGILMAEVPLIDEIYETKGFEHGDKLVANFSQSLISVVGNPDHLIARLSKNEFAILAPDATADSLLVIANSMINLVNNLDKNIPVLHPPKIAIGIAINEPTNENPSSLLAQVDNALANAKAKVKAPINLIDKANVTNKMGKQNWKSLLMDAMEHDWFIFKFQPVTSRSDKIYHHEVFTAIELHKQSYNASHFIAQLEQLDLYERFDRYVLEKIINKLTENATLGPLAVNLNQYSVIDASFIRWVTTLMQQHRNLAGRLLFEIPENVFIHYPDHVALLTEQAHRFNFGFGVDNYGRDFKSLDYLNRFKPAYVKIDFAYTTTLDNESQRQVLASICRTANNLNITTIATRIETASQLAELNELFINGFQGYLFEKKRPAQN